MQLDLDKLTQLDDAALLEALEAAAEYRKYNKLEFVQPYPKQLEFFEMGAHKQERMLFAGNQMGKSYAGAIETAYHLTGLYPDGWAGRRWGRPVKAWAAGESITVCRDVGQTLLCGEPGVDEEFGAGLIPRHLFVGKPTRVAGSAVADAYDTIRVRHASGGVSTLQFKGYEQGRKKFQGRTLDFVWWDEEPSMDVYVEGNARWSATGGMSFMTFTPLQGYSDVVCRFLRPAADEDPEAVAMRGHLVMGYRDALHMTPEMLKSNLAKYPVHEHEARMNGHPMLGEGRVFVINRALVSFPRSLHIPDEFAKLWGVDFGITHPFAAVFVAWDRELDIIYVLHTYRAAGQTPLVHSEAIRQIAAGFPVAWPHDGNKREESKTGEFMPLYKKFNLDMMSTHAHYPKGGFSTEAAVLEMDQRFQKAGGPGGIRICDDLGDLWDEISMYHRKDGMLVKIRDDLISALHKALMMKRYGKVGPVGWRPRPDPNARLRARTRGRLPLNPWTGRPAY